MARPTSQRAVALPERALLHCLTRHALERSYGIGLADTRLLVLWREPRCVLLSALFLRPTAGLNLAVCKGVEGVGVVWLSLWGAMPFQTVFELLLVYGWLVKRLAPAPVWQDQPGDAAHVVFHHLPALHRPPGQWRPGTW